MSWQASGWAANLPASVCGNIAFRVLVKLADVAQPNGTAAWRHAQEMADELGVSLRSVRRALSDLRELGLIQYGDQQHVAHIRKDRRPTVYDLPLGKSIEPTLDTPRGDEPVTPHEVTTTVTSSAPRGDTHGYHGVTTGVTPNSRTIQERSNSSTSVTPVQARESDAPRCIQPGDIVTVGKGLVAYAVESLYTAGTRDRGQVQFANLRPVAGGPTQVARAYWCRIAAEAGTTAAARLAPQPEQVGAGQ